MELPETKYYERLQMFVVKAVKIPEAIRKHNIYKGAYGLPPRRTLF